MLIPKHKNQAVLELTDAISNRLSTICAPLFNQFSISHFSYMKIFNNGKRLFLCPNSKWVRYYVEHDFQNDKVHPRHRPHKMGIHYGVWSSFPKDKIFSALYELDIWNGFTIFDRHQNYMECYHFATKRKNDQISNFFLANIDVLTHFIFYFKDKVSDIISNPNAHALIISEIPLSYEFNEEELLINNNENDNKIKNFFIETTAKKYRFEYNNQLFSFSKRELECLLHVSRGKTAKIIAKQLNISPRTVESYINNMKNKIGCTTDQLNAILLQNRLIQQAFELKEKQ